MNMGTAAMERGRGLLQRMDCLWLNVLPNAPPWGASASIMLARTTRLIIARAPKSSLSCQSQRLYAWLQSVTALLLATYRRVASITPTRCSRLSAHNTQ